MPYEAEHTSPDAGWTLDQSAPGGQIADSRVELTVGARAQHAPQPLIKLLDMQSTLISGPAKPNHNLFAIGIRRSHITTVISHPTTILPGASDLNLTGEASAARV